MKLQTIFYNFFAFSPTVSVAVLVCKLRYIMRVVYSGFAVIWNALVACVVISVCRTHVIGKSKLFFLCFTCSIHYSDTRLTFRLSTDYLVVFK